MKKKIKVKAYKEGQKVEALKQKSNDIKKIARSIPTGDQNRKKKKHTNKITTETFSLQTQYNAYSEEHVFKYGVNKKR